MLPAWQMTQLVIEGVLLALHMALTVFVAVQAIKGRSPFRNAFYVFYFLQSVADIGGYLAVGSAYSCYRSFALLICEVRNWSSAPYPYATMYNGSFSQARARPAGLRV